MRINGDENCVNLLRFCGWCLACGVLSACSLTKEPVPIESEAFEQAEPQPQLQQEQTPEQQQEAKMPQEALPRYSQLVERLLLQAKSAFYQGRYTLPVHDNAFDKFHSVLLLAPNNTEAKSGLQAVRLKLAELAREAAYSGDFQRARILVERIVSVFSSDALVDNLNKDIAHIENTFAGARAEGAEVVETSKVIRELILPKSALSARAETVKATLSNLAQRLKETKEGVLIYARNDSEGRWIYRQLKSASSGYRIRGDIRIDKKPRVELLAPY